MDSRQRRWLVFRDTDRNFVVRNLNGIPAPRPFSFRSLASAQRRMDELEQQDALLEHLDER